MSEVRLAFNYDDANKAAQEWNANCGPGALAAVLGVHIEDVRGLIPNFEKRGYVSPTMMREALNASGTNWVPVISSARVQPSYCPDILPDRSVVRIQWTGPWTRPGMNPKWAYNHTHWIATFRESGRSLIFDINRGLTTYEDWLVTVPPLITSDIKRADGGWFLTHIWRVEL